MTYQGFHMLHHFSVGQAGPEIRVQEWSQICGFVRIRIRKAMRLSQNLPKRLSSGEYASMWTDGVKIVILWRLI